LEEIRRQLEGISRHGDSPAEYAAWIVNGGRARIFLKEDDPDGGTRVVHLREPVAQFWHRHAEYPAFVLEVSYSQDGKDPKELAWDYIQYSNGDIKVVIGIQDAAEAVLAVVTALVAATVCGRLRRPCLLVTRS